MTRLPELHFILTCDGGNGHKSAADALSMRATAAGNTYKIVNTTSSGWYGGGGLDISYKYDFLFRNNAAIDTGPFFTRSWDWAQRTGHIELLRILASLRKFALLSIPSFRYRTFELLKERQDIDQYSKVIFHNTQPNCLNALIFSVARYNREVNAHNKNNPENPRNTVKLINHFTDLPTVQAQMFIEEMNSINVADLNDAEFELHTRPPIIYDDNPNLSAKERESLYHQRTSMLYPRLYEKLPENTNRVKFVEGPIRAEFLNRKENPAKRCDGLGIKFTNQAEFDVLNKTLGNALGTFDSKTSCANMPLADDAEIISLMLGSQASIEGTLSLVEEEIRFLKQSSALGVKNLFVFCGANDPKKGLVLYQKVLEIAKNVNTNPDNQINIIPLTNQPASMIADIYSLADKIITRPGGISIMEIEAVAKKSKIFVFTELGKLEKFFNRLFSRSNKMLEDQFGKQGVDTRYKDLIVWEEGNARHLTEHQKDRYGRTCVVPINTYTYRKELDLLCKKEQVTQFIADKRYTEALNELRANAELNAFFLTGYGSVGVDLACLVELIRLYDQINNDLSDLIKKNSVLETLEKGPATTLTLISEVKTHIFSQLNQQEIPSAILQDTFNKTMDIKRSLKESIGAVKKSNIENKSSIIRALEFLSRAFLNFFRWIFRLRLELTPEADLEKVNNNIQEIMDRPLMNKIKEYNKNLFFLKPETSKTESENADPNNNNSKGFQDQTKTK